MRIGVWDRSWPGWTSGSEYTRAQAAALLAVREESRLDLSIVAEAPTREHFPVGSSSVRIVAQPAIGGRSRPNRVLDRFLRKSRLGPVSQLRKWRSWSTSVGFDVLLSFEPPNWWWEPCDVATTFWIWDLQHLLMPEMFPDQYRKDLDKRFRRESARCDLVVVSSEASRRDYAEFMPSLAEKVHVYHFPSRYRVRRGAHARCRSRRRAGEVPD